MRHLASVAERPLPPAATRFSWNLSRLLDPYSTETFVAEHWEREPLHVRRDDPAYYEDLLTMDGLDALLSAATGDDAIKQKGDVLVAELAKCQQKLNQDGYLSAYPTNFYDRLKEGKRVWAPFYTYHKILAGHFGYVHALRKRAGSMRTTTTGAMASVRSKRGRSASTFIGAVTRKTEVLGRTNSLACAG